MIVTGFSCLLVFYSSQECLMSQVGDCQKHPLWWSLEGRVLLRKQHRWKEWWGRRTCRTSVHAGNASSNPAEVWRKYCLSQLSHRGCKRRQVYTSSCSALGSGLPRERYDCRQGGSLQLRQILKSLRAPRSWAASLSLRGTCPCLPPMVTSFCCKYCRLQFYLGLHWIYRWI